MEDLGARCARFKILSKDSFSNRRIRSLLIERPRSKATAFALPSRELDAPGNLPRDGRGYCGRRGHSVVLAQPFLNVVVCRIEKQSFHRWQRYREGYPLQSDKLY